MPTISNLSQYYDSIGKPLPKTAQERFADPAFAAAAKAAGISADKYMVNSQNSAFNQKILQNLISGPKTPTPTDTEAGAPAAPSDTQADANTPTEKMLPRARSNKPIVRSEDEIFKELVDHSAGIKKAITDKYDYIKQQTKAGTAGVLAGAGLTGSTAAYTKMLEAEKPLLEAQQKETEELLSTIRDKATEQHKYEVQEGRQTRLDLEKEAESLAKKGVDPMRLAESNPDEYDAILNNAFAGDTKAMQGYFIANTPGDQLINEDKPIISGSTVTYLKKQIDPKTGKVSIVPMVIDTGTDLEGGKNNQIMRVPGDGVYLINKQTGKATRVQGPGGGSDGGDGSGSGGKGGDFAATIDAVANMESSVAGKKAVKAQLQGLIEAGDYTSAYNQIANTVENGLVGSSKTRFADARTDYEVLSGLQDAIEAYSNAGGDMGILKGGAESIAKKLGKVKDPAYKSLATELEREFQAYRNAMTGAAFTPEESAEYASVNPSGNKTLDLNLAVVNGALAQLENRVTKTINSRVPSAKYILDYAHGAKPGQQDGGGDVAEEIIAAGGIDNGDGTYTMDDGTIVSAE